MAGKPSTLRIAPPTRALTFFFAATMLAGCLGTSLPGTPGELPSNANPASALEAFAKAAAKAKAWSDEAYLADAFGADGRVSDMVYMPSPFETFAYPIETDGNLSDGRLLKWEFSFERPDRPDARYAVAVLGDEIWAEARSQAMSHRIRPWSVDSTEALRAAVRGSPQVSAALSCATGVWYTLQDGKGTPQWSMAIHGPRAGETQPVLLAWVDATDGRFLGFDEVLETPEFYEEFEGRLTTEDPTETRSYQASRSLDVNLRWEEGRQGPVAELRDGKGRLLEPNPLSRTRANGAFYSFFLESPGAHELTLRMPAGSPAAEVRYSGDVRTHAPALDHVPCWRGVPPDA